MPICWSAIRSPSVPRSTASWTAGSRRCPMPRARVGRQGFSGPATGPRWPSCWTSPSRPGPPGAPRPCRTAAAVPKEDTRNQPGQRARREGCRHRAGPSVAAHQREDRCRRAAGVRPCPPSRAGRRRRGAGSGRRRARRRRHAGLETAQTVHRRARQRLRAHGQGVQWTPPSTGEDRGGTVLSAAIQPGVERHRTGLAPGEVPGLPDAYPDQHRRHRKGRRPGHAAAPRPNPRISTERRRSRFSLSDARRQRAVHRLQEQPGAVPRQPAQAPCRRDHHRRPCTG